MKIKRVSFSEKGEYVTLSLDNKTTLTVPSEIYLSLSSSGVGEELDEGAFCELSFADECYRATKKALGILSFSDNSERRLYEKLRGRGISRRAAETAVEKMKEYGYLDEKKQLFREVLHLANGSLFGAKKIVAKLSSVGYSPSDIRLAVRELSDMGEINFDESLKRLMEKKLGEDYTDEQYRALRAKWGY